MRAQADHCGAAHGGCPGGARTGGRDRQTGEQSMASEPPESRTRGKHPTEDVIYGRLVDAIIAKTLRPGQHLNEARLAEAHGVPRSRVRRVLERLRGESVVTFELNRGAFISRPTVKEAFDVYEARRDIELCVIRRVCERASLRDVDRLRRHLKAEDSAFQSGNPNVNRISGDFHLLLGAMSRNPVFEALLVTLVRRWVLIQSVYERQRDSLCLTHEHGTIVDCIAERRADDAAAELARHFEHILAALDLTEDRRTRADIYAGAS